jgi:S-adenosylmethionine:tRNA ribosyltransferase-isomerase
VPLPPYIEHGDTAEDERRYQTVFAKNPGAVAAPTAALHFDEGVLAALDARGVQRASVTLLVGAGTFQPCKTENIAEHVMHSEWYEVPEATQQAGQFAEDAVHRRGAGAVEQAGGAAFGRRVLGNEFGGQRKIEIAEGVGALGTGGLKRHEA